MKRCLFITTGAAAVTCRGLLHFLDWLDFHTRPRGYW